MTRIKADLARLNELSGSMNRLGNRIVEIKHQVDTATSRLDWQVASKQNINSRLANLSKKINNQTLKMEKYAQFVQTAAGSFSSTDKKIKSQSKNVLYDMHKVILAGILPAMKIPVSWHVKKHKDLIDAVKGMFGSVKAGVIADLRLPAALAGTTMCHITYAPGYGPGYTPFSRLLRDSLKEGLASTEEKVTGAFDWFTDRIGDFKAGQKIYELFSDKKLGLPDGVKNSMDILDYGDKGIDLIKSVIKGDEVDLHKAVSKITEKATKDFGKMLHPELSGLSPVQKLPGSVLLRTIFNMEENFTEGIRDYANGKDISQVDIYVNSTIGAFGEAILEEAYGPAKFIAGIGGMDLGQEYKKHFGSSGIDGVIEGQKWFWKDIMWEGVKTLPQNYGSLFKKLFK